MAKRIGICRALHAYHHYAFWQAFFSGLGWEVVLSAPTSRRMIEQGVRLSPSELCLPVKAFLGHVAELKDNVDALFLPRIVCTKVAGDWFFGCPKAIALPDLTRAVFESLPLVVEPVLDGQIRTDEKSFRAAVSGIDRKADVRSAYRSASAAARAATQRTRDEGSPLHMFSERGPRAEDRRAGDRHEKREARSERIVTRRPSSVSRHSVVKIGVVGHPYLLFDSGLSLDVLDEVKEAGGRPVVVFPTEADVASESRQQDALNWYYELELLAAARRLLEIEKVDGLLLVASFACGTGAVTNELIQRAAVHRHGVPTILLLLDEHTGEAGLVTRIESFVDLLRLRKR